MLRAAESWSRLLRQVVASPFLERFQSHLNIVILGKVLSPFFSRGIGLNALQRPL